MKKGLDTLQRRPSLEASNSRPDIALLQRVAHCLCPWEQAPQRDKPPHLGLHGGPSRALGHGRQAGIAEPVRAAPPSRVGDRVPGAPMRLCGLRHAPGSLVARVLPRAWLHLAELPATAPGCSAAALCLLPCACAGWGRAGQGCGCVRAAVQRGGRAEKGCQHAAADA